MNPRKDLSPEIAGLWEQLDGSRGKKYWRTLEELADSDAFAELIHREFPEQAAEWPAPLNRRQFLTLMGASLALAGLSGCSVRPAPTKTLVPYVHAPEEMVPGKPLFYATAMTLGGCGVGLLVESHEGRPTKIEGNPEHPASLGGTGVFQQAAVLTLYDPDRSQTVTHLGKTVTWDDAFAGIRTALADQHARQGDGVRILTESVVSPTLVGQLHDFLNAFPKAVWHQYEPLAPDNADRAAVLAFGESVDTIYDFSKADVILSLDADFLNCGPGELRYVHDFADRRRAHEAARMNRLYVMEPALTNTGAKADHRQPLRARDIERFTRALAAELQVPGAPPALPEPKTAAFSTDWLRHVAADLRFLDPEKPGGKRNRPRPPGTTLVIAGDRQPPAVHLLVHAINQHLGNVGATVKYIAPIAAQPALQQKNTPKNAPVERNESLRQLTADMRAGNVKVLIIVGSNPVFTAPVDFNFREAMQGVPLRVHMGPYQDETARQCHWHLPEAHFLEAWSDTRAYDGTPSIVQPLIEPLHEGRSAHEVFAALTPVIGHNKEITWRIVPGYEIVRNHWSKQANSGSFETFWQTTVHDGVVTDYKPEIRNVKLNARWADQLPGVPDTEVVTDEIELLFQQDPAIYDGRFANNGWLQEMPRPITRLAWDNAAFISPALAKRFGVALGGYAHGGEHGGFQQPMIELRVGERTLKMPAWIVPGNVDYSVTVHVGYGREHAGRIGGDRDTRVGFNVYTLRTSEHPWIVPTMLMRLTGDTHLLACTQQDQLMENRDAVRAGTVQEFEADPDFARKNKDNVVPRLPLTLYKEHPSTPNKWGMAIDLTACVGCNVCVVACQAENNIPVVGKNQVLAGREMHWLRVDRYNAGPFDAPTEFHFQPLPCMHCENAPCEYVCPVEATVHSADGLNEMLYQRCVGTRFCSNNCPYKVRRFNFFSYANFTDQTIQLQYNPDVTVRSRGVMEKCSYCVQRIRKAQIGAEKENRPIRDGEILTACQAACPAQAIVFGDIDDPNSKVRKMKESPLNYGLLDDLNTQPRTTYLAALRNPNPDMEA